MIRAAQHRLWRVRPNPLRHASEWWDYARASHNAPEIMPLLDPMPEEEIHASDAEAAAIRHWAADIPGWEALGPSPEHTLIIKWLGEHRDPKTARRQPGS
jgi:hypothetical protein